MFFYLTFACFLASLVLGGPTKHGSLQDALLQLCAVPLLLLAGWRLCNLPKTQEVRWSLAFCAAIVALPLVQLIPLPPFIWTQLAGREALVSTYTLLGRAPDWAAISLSGQETWLSMLSLLPPLTLFLAVLTLDWRECRLLSLLLVAFAVLSGFVALLQAAQGVDSPFRFYNVDLRDPSPVGFFVNRNHLGALLYCGAAFATAWLLASYDAVRLDRDRIDHKTIISMAGSAFALVALVSVELVVRSRAGVLLLVLGLGALPILAAIRPSPQAEFDGAMSESPGRRRWLPIAAAFIVLALVAFFFVGWSSIQGVLDRFGGDPLSDERPVFAKVTFFATKAFMPVGSGLGSFVSAYQMFEKPRDMFSGVYANHAHNDLLELALETGVAGLMLLCVFLAWLAARARKVWTPINRPVIDVYLQDAAVVVVFLVLGHSLMDYPLRTNAMLSVFAFACALLIKAPGGDEAHAPGKARQGRRRRRDALAQDAA